MKLQRNGEVRRRCYKQDGSITKYLFLRMNKKISLSYTIISIEEEKNYYNKMELRNVG